jgi:hypothetical protein
MVWKARRVSSTGLTYPAMRDPTILPIHKRMKANHSIMPQQVARMERSAIRDHSNTAPGFRFAPSGLRSLRSLLCMGLFSRFFV